ncbi:MAG TPA: hypothetical protein VFI20_12085 [Terracidiphilus sp.]|nr:hypothetical protein [Terracidiphilus sp.]
MTRPSVIPLLVLAVLAVGAVPARAAGDTVHFGNSINVPAGESIHDAVCFFCSVRVDGAAEHDIVVFFGSVQISGHAEHDVVNFFGNVWVADDGSIGHDLVNFFGGVRLGENARVGRDMVVMFGDVRSSPTATVGGNSVTQPMWLALIPLAILGLIVVLIVGTIRQWQRRRMLAAYPFPPPPHP